MNILSIPTIINNQVHALVLRGILKSNRTLSNAVLNALIPVILLAVVTMTFRYDRDMLMIVIYGVASMNILMSAFRFSSADILISRVRENIFEILVSPCTGFDIVVSYCIVCVYRAFIMSLCIPLLSMLFFGEFYISNPVLFFTFMVLGTFVFASIGIVSAAWVYKYETLTNLDLLLLSPLGLMSGSFFTLSSIPQWAANVCKFNPAFSIISGMRGSIMGVYEMPVLCSLTIAAVSALVCFLGSCWLLNKYRERLMPLYM